MRRTILVLASLVVVTLVASPVFAHPGGATHGDKYSKNYYPNSYITDGVVRYDWYTEYQKKQYNGKWYYYVHVYYQWKDRNGTWHKQDYWYYCQFHKYDDPFRKQPYFRAWVTKKPTGQGNWERFTWDT